MDNKLAIRLDIPDNVPSEYIGHLKSHALDELALKLFDYLFQGRGQQYCVRIMEKSRHPHEYVVECSLTAVKYNTAEIRLPRYEDMPWNNLSYCAVDEIKRRIKRWFKRSK